VGNSVNLSAYSFRENYLKQELFGFDQKFKPSWFKNLKSYFILRDQKTKIDMKTPTVVSCPGIRDFLSLPIHIKMWCDATIKIWPEGTITFNGAQGGDFICGIHGNEQYGDELYKNRLAVKIVTPWNIVSKSNTKFLLMESHYSGSFFRDHGLYLSPGVINFKNQHSTNVHISCPVKDQPYEIQLRYGQPLVSLFPLTEKNVKVDYKLTDINSFRDLSDKSPAVWTGRYYKKLNCE